MSIYQIGRHRVRHGDIMDDLGELVPDSGVDFIYTDPPWGQGNLAYWQTMNKKMTGADPKGVDLDAFLGRIFTIIADHSHDETVVFIEYGLRWRDMILERAGKIGLSAYSIATPVYGSGNRPLNLFTMAFKPLSLQPGYQASIDGTKGFQTLLMAAAPFDMRGKTFFDPCCGLGYTARLAIRNGGSFVGNELNLKRLQKTMELLREDISEGKRS